MKKNSLAAKRPDLIKEWHPTKNGDLTPYDVTFSDHRKAWWICSENHEWQASIANRARLNRNCPYCAHQKVLVGETDLATTNPKLAKEWDYEKNGDLTPKDVFKSSHRKVWWKCKKGHSWQAQIKSRSIGVGCPYCVNVKPTKGYNDLQTVRPDLAAEWHPTKNDCNPDEVTYGSGKIAWWICKNGHEYKSRISYRNAGGGCKICTQRRRTSYPEQALYFYIKKIFPDAINSYKDIFNNGMELDIYIPSIKTGIEYDGKYYHKGPKAHEKELRKYNICNKSGIKLIRVKEEIHDEDRGTYDKAYSIENLESRKQLEIQIQYILNELDPESNMFTRKKAKFYSGVRVNLKKDNNEILSYLTALDKSLLTEYPKVAKEWHPTKNNGLKPEMFHPGSNEKVWWLCSKCGHEWKTLIRERTANHTGCAICARKIGAKKKHATDLKNKKSLAETNPKLLKKWNYEKNTILPSEITEGSGDKLWWKCPTCGYEWQSTIAHVKRTDSSCPYCNGKVVISGKNDLKSQYSKLMEEWNYDKNKDLDPSKLLLGSGKYAWWLCHKCGYEWKTKIYLRTNKKCNCPKCGKKLKKTS